MKALSCIVSAFLIALFVVVLTIFSGASPLVFVDFPSLILVTALSFLSLFLAFTPAEAGRALITLFSRGPAGRPELEKARLVFKTLSRNQLLAGGFGSLFGFISALTNIRDTSAVGVGLAVALLTLLYSFFGTLVFSVPAEAALKTRLAEME